MGERFFNINKHKLNNREIFILEQLYGFNGMKKHSAKEIALNLGISQSYVLRIETTAIHKFKASCMLCGEKINPLKPNSDNLCDNCNIKRINNIFNAILKSNPDIIKNQVILFNNQPNYKKIYNDLLNIGQTELQKSICYGLKHSLDFESSTFINFASANILKELLLFIDSLKESK